jgi:hypothetical protein
MSEIEYLARDLAAQGKANWIAPDTAWMINQQDIVQAAQGKANLEVAAITCEGLNLPESWHCVDCGFDTAPDLFDRGELWNAIEEAKAAGKWNEDWRSDVQKINGKSEVYTVRDVVWKKAGMAEFGGCLCIGCLETRLGRQLKPKDFDRRRWFNQVPSGTPRLLKRRPLEAMISQRKRRR